MRWSATKRIAMMGLAALSFAAPLQAQTGIVWDGNILWNNNDNTLAGQYTGTAGAGAPACPAGTTAFTIGTVSFTHNLLSNPLLDGAVNLATNSPFITAPNFQPRAGSPAFHSNASHVSIKINDPWFDQTCFTGAIGPDAGDDWTQGWTYYDSLGTNRQDLHLAGMPNPRPLRILDNVQVPGFYTMSVDSNYLVRGQLRVLSGGSLTVPAGTVIFGERATLGTIIANRGGKLFMNGTKANPIIATSDDAPGSQVRGGWGGIWLLGKAVCNCANTAAGDSCASEGGAIGYFGGNDDADNSGVIQYTRCEYSGFPISLDNELNSFTFDAVGTGTVLDHLQAHRGDDDGIEFFGGVARVKYALATDGNDDGFDWQMGYRGKAQYLIVRELADGLQTDKGIEADNNEFGFDTTNGPRSNAIVANATFIGDRRSGAGFPGCTYGVHFRRGTSGTVLNSIIFNFKNRAFRIEADATFQAACVAGFQTDQVYCDNGTVGVGQPAGPSGFASRATVHGGAVRIDFTLPVASTATVQIVTADGRIVHEAAAAYYGAGANSVTWNARDGVRGVYFYRVVAGGLGSAGRIVRAF